MELISLLIINISFLVQLISAFVALRLIVHSGKAPAGVVMLAGIALMAFRRSISLYRVIDGLPVDLFAEIVACIVSVTLLIGFLYFSRTVEHLGQEMRRRREAEKTLKETNAQLQALVYAIPDMVVFKDIEGRHILVNKTAEEFIGLKREDLIGKTNEELLPSDLAASCRRSDQEAMASPCPVQTEEQFSGRDGRQVFLETVKARIHDERGFLRGIVGVSRDITVRKQTEETLRRLSRQKELILNAAGDGIFGLTQEGLITFINPAAAKMTGWNSEDLMGRPCRFLIEGSGRQGPFSEPGECRILTALKTGTSMHAFVEVFRRKDGTPFPVEYVGTHIKERDHVIGAVIVFKDITERKHREEEAQYDQRRLSSLLKISQQKTATSHELLSASLDEAVALSDSEFGFLYYYSEEKQEFSLHAWSRKAVQQSTISDPAVVCKLEGTGLWGEAVRQRRPIAVNDYSAAHPLKRGHPPGHAPLKRFIIHPVFSDDRIVAVIGVANKASDYSDMDVRQLGLMMESVWKITERRNTEEALFISEERLRMALSAANTGMYDLNIQTGEAEVSPEYATMLGYDPAMFRETNELWIDRLHPEDREPTAAVYRDYIAGKVPIYAVESRQRTRTGEWKWILSVGRIVQWDPDGKPLRMLGTHTDITERRRLVEQLEHLNRDLSERVREEIEKNRAQEQLMQLQSRHAAMGEMIDNIAHQWRQPLNNLGLIVQGMHLKYSKGTLTAEKLREASKTAMSLVRYMSQTISDFTNFFRHDKEMLRFRVSEVTSTALSFMETSLKRNAIEVAVHIPDDITVKGYRNEYTQVLVNILNNARDIFLDRNVRNPAIAIRAFRDNGTAVLTVADNGGGIADDMMDRMFTPYVTTKPRNRGTGIGLYMSRMIIENNMNGRLSVCNRGEGAEFRIEVRHGD